MTLHLTEYEKEQQKKIVKELEKYSMSVFLNFKFNFPCSPLLRLTINYKILKRKPVFSIGEQLPVGNTDYYDFHVLLYEYAGSQKFWKDWNRYKNLKAFL